MKAGIQVDVLDLLVVLHKGGKEDRVGQGHIYSDPELVQQAETAAKQVVFLSISNRAPRVFSGVIATADVFVSDQESAEKLFSDYQALATEMEGAAVAHLCRELGIPFIVLRSCSDNANKSARVSFNQFVRPAAINSAGIVLQLLKNMN